jgi:hypothetical protein
LRESAAQAAARLGHGKLSTTIKRRASVLREQLGKIQKV